MVYITKTFTKQVNKRQTKGTLLNLILNVIYMKSMERLQVYDTLDMFEKLRFFTVNAICNNKFAHCPNFRKLYEKFIHRLLN
jgi:hypothetical protein